MRWRITDYKVGRIYYMDLLDFSSLWVFAEPERHCPSACVTSISLFPYLSFFGHAYPSSGLLQTFRAISIFDNSNV